MGIRINAGFGIIGFDNKWCGGISWLLAIRLTVASHLSGSFVRRGWTGNKLRQFGDLFLNRLVTTVTGEKSFG